MSKGTVLITGSSGLVGSACVRHFAGLGWRVYGADSNARKGFFGPDGDTTAVKEQLLREVSWYMPTSFDVRHGGDMAALITAATPDLVIHCAAQPSHDYATREPLLDFETNAVGTLNVLNAVRVFAPAATFIFASTNKVYGDTVNRLPLVELETRYDFHPDSPHAEHGIGEWMSVDQCRHSVFGASKLAADVLTQEFSHTYGLTTGVFRMGCITGGAHAGAELHGFLAYLVKCCREGRPYTVFGYKGKQVRDQLHAADVARAFACFAETPRAGAVYNLGGGRANSCSVLEAIDAVQERCGKRLDWSYVDEPRGGDHVCWYSDNGRFMADYPGWSVRVSLGAIFDELCEVQEVAVGN